ncbi:MAG: Ribosomal RNA small subunit methyltransferase H [Syntrophorhabdus sp. PtaU1.Bin058]|nr:MAG: Ribosomal RNA small subunit methyltransferase H [Syntrophorhabdus sp. PtaU1.Bin058]
MIGVTHIPVLCEEVIENLVSAEYSLFVDATVGGGGHAHHILERYKGIRLIGLDADEEALHIAQEVLRGYGERVQLVRGNFKDLKEILNGIGISSFDGILFDLGLSTYQLTGERGFSFNDEVFPDMRMDDRAELTAYDVVNTYRYDVLKKIIGEYGEEEKAHRIAKAIVEERKKRPIATSKELAGIILKVKKRRGKIHPATKTFQAIRMEVNREPENLRTGVLDAIDMLNRRGRIGVISFHSLEDRTIKGIFKTSAVVNAVTKKPIRPERDEIRKNPSSRSAKLRVAEKI